MTKQTFRDFLRTQERGKYMTHGQFMLSLRDHDYESLVASARNGETLRDVVVRWAAKHAPDITIVDDDYDDGKDPGTQYKIVDDDEDD